MQSRRLHQQAVRLVHAPHRRCLHPRSPTALLPLPPAVPELQAIFTQFITSEAPLTGQGTWKRYYAPPPGDAAGARAAGATPALDRAPAHACVPVVPAPHLCLTCRRACSPPPHKY